MNGIDQLSSQLFEEAKRFLEKASDAGGDEVSSEAYSHAALLLGFSSLEAHMNAIADELTMRSNLSLLDVSILKEQEISLEKGIFEIKNKLKMYRFEDRLMYIFKNFSQGGSFQINSSSWWGDLKAGIDLRNQLVHPKAGVVVNVVKVSLVLTAVLDCLNDLYHQVYGRPFPTHKRGLNSSFSF